MRCLQLKRWIVSALIPILGVAILGLVWGAETPAHAAHSAKAGHSAKTTHSAKKTHSAKSARSTKPASSAKAQGAGQFVDGIAAIVNKNVITLGQLNSAVDETKVQLKTQKIAAPDESTLRKQVLQRMIMEELERQEAERLGIKVSDAQVEQAVQMVASNNKITVDRLHQEIKKSGLSWEIYLKDLRRQVLFGQLRQRAVDSKILISDADVDAFLKAESRQPGSQMRAPEAPQAAAPAPAPRQTGPAVLGLAQILVKVPDGSSSSRVQELRGKAEAILAKLRGGADFASVSAASSDAPEALEGGQLGVRPVNGWPDLFINATKNLRAGQLSGIIQSGNGFHILKVLTRGAPAERSTAAAAAATPPPSPSSATAAAPQSQGPMMVTQTHARHILIKVTKVMTDEQAQTRLKQIRERLESGENFTDLAKRYSQDASAPLGGDLGWLSPSETVPPFEQAMDALQPNQISQPVKTQFGWHLIQVLERRTKNMETEYKRMQARRAIFQRRSDPAFEDWLNQLRGQAYIDNRIDPQPSQARR
ncbi:MAG: peptidylprolyl isomerase [Burkholderiaceae bacterium]